MFAVIYRGFVKPGFEAEYQKIWHQIAQYFIQHCGAIGSCLHQTEDGMWLAYSRWPNKATRDAAWPGENAASEKSFPDEIQKAIVMLKNYLDLDRKLPEICMTVMDDLL
jgi:hypothetical protein